MSMSNATAVPNAYLPSACQKIDGRFWLLFHNGGTFEEFKALPNALKYEGRVYVKKGWNSDLNTVHYAEGNPAVAV
jgi:hypothetical protein